MTKDEFDEIYKPKEFGGRFKISVRRKHETDFRQKREWDSVNRKWLGSEPIEVTEDKGWNIQLPHQCDEWEIGDVDDAKEFKIELQKVIEYCQANS